MTAREHSTSKVRIHADDQEPSILELPVLHTSPDLSAFAYAFTGDGSHEQQPLKALQHAQSPGPAVKLAVDTHAGIDTPVQITYRDIRFSVEVPQAKKQGGGTLTREILKGCTGSFEPGRLTAVMGASGAGKTSLLNIISGNATKGKTEGTILMNGLKLNLDEMARMREISAYIQQDDILIATMTVREYVTLSAKLRLPKSMPLSEKLERVERTIEILGLNKCANTIIGNQFNKGISGGEKRRVSMALELIKSPSILFLDEPTSGLDTFTAFSIMGMLRDVAREQGKTVICTIHQPSSDIWQCFDDLVLMADGQIMYHGPAAKVVDYFDRAGYKCPSNFNPADHLFMKVLYNMEAQLALVAADMNYETQVVSAHSKHHTKTGHSAEWLKEREVVSKAAYEASAKEEVARVASLLEAWNSSPEHQKLMQLVDHPLTTPLPDPTAMRAERPGELYAFTLLSKRRWWDLLRDKMKLRVQFFQYLFFSLLIGTIFLRVGHDQNSVQDRQGCLFFVSVQAMFMSFLSNLNTFGPEKVVMKREMQSGLYGLPAYFFSRWIIEVPFRIIFPFTYALILFFLVRFQTANEHFILAAIALILIDNCGTNMSIMICSMFPDVQQAMQAGPAFILPLMLFSGFYIQLHSIGWWFRWISYISPIRWGFVALIKNEMKGLLFECPSPPLACPAPNGEAVITALGLDSEPSIALNLFIMLILLGGFLIGAFSFMWLTTKKR